MGKAGYAVLIVAWLAAGCASAPGPRVEQDPWESYNRSMHAFNENVDRAVVKPLAKGYETVLPQPIRTGIGNFFSNLDDVVVFFNNLLQRKGARAASDGGRVLVNTTLGLFGIFDVASRMGMRKHDEDFGQTMGYWGTPPGPYFVLPLLGPSTLRDAPARLVDMQVSPLHLHGDEGVRTGLIALNAVDIRAGLLQSERILDEVGGDRYAVIRDAWLARREYLVHDGKPPGAQEAGDDLLRELEAMEFED